MMRLAIIIGVVAGIAGIGWIVFWLSNGGWPATGPTGDAIPRHIKKVNPADGAVVTEAQGYCLHFSFREGNGMGPDLSRIHAYLDGANITPNIGGTIDLMTPHISGTLCYKQDEFGTDLAPRWHTAKVVYTDSKNKKFVYTWRFRVENE